VKDYESNITQVDAEINEYIELLRKYNVKSYLEIGSAYGGSLWRVANSLPQGSRVLSIDLEPKDSLKECIAELNIAGYTAHLVPFDSTKLEAIRIASLMGPFDAVFIDGNHTLPYVSADWLNYGSLSHIVAFHDINAPYKPHRRNPMMVAQLWGTLKTIYKTQEIIAPGSRQGIGVLWR
jgi:predicted O-methyltransferase YrrM